MTPPPSPTFSPSDFEALRAEIEELSQFPMDAQTLDKWRTLQKQVEALCNRLAAGPAAEAHAALPDLAQIINILDQVIEMEE